jgi:hypothetical protein
MKINIAISAYNRPEYSQRSLAALLGAKGYSLDKYKIFCAMDCYENGDWNKEVYDVYTNFRISPFVAKQKQGCNYTVKKALELAWEDGPDFVLLIEDDVIISDDALLYIEWAAEKYKDDPSVRTIGLWGHNQGYSIDTPLKESEHGKVIRQNYFTCWGWGTWRDRWEEMFDTWTTGDDSHNTSWDVIVSNHLGDRVEILPSISRAYNCGENGGTHRGRAWPGIVASGLIDPDGQIEYWEYNIPEVDEEQPIYVILGRFGDIYMVAKQLKKPSIIACLEEFSGILDELLPEHTCIKLRDLPRNNPILAAKILSMSHPFHTIIICQQDGTPLENMKEFRTFQTYQEHHAKSI